MDFQRYINHSQTKQTYRNTCSNMKNSAQIKPRIIKFVGNMQENIKQLLNDLDCSCGIKKEFYNILIVFANKIQKLRNERDHYKVTLKEYLVGFQKKQENNKNDLNNNKLIQQEYKQNLMINSLKPTLFYQQPKQMIFKTAQKKKQRKQNNLIKSSLKQKQDQIKQFNKIDNLNLTAINKNQPIKNKDQFYQQFKKNKDQFYYQFKQFINIKNINTQIDNKLKYFQQKDINQKQQFHQNNQINIDQEGEFSFNLSSFQEDKIDNDKVKETNDFMKQLSSIMSQTNLLDSDDDQQQEQFKNNQIINNLEELNQQTIKLKIIKQSNNLNLDSQKQYPKSNLQASQLVKQQIPKTSSTKKKEFKENVISKVITKKSSSILNTQSDKQNRKVDSCLKKYNITLEKLEDFIEKKQCLKQLQKTQNMCGLSGFKTVNSCTLQKNPTQKAIRNIHMSNIQPLQQKKFNFNI